MNMDKEIDILLIDGDHSYEGVKADYERYVPFVKKGGLILIHDVCNHGAVKRFWKELKDGIVLPLSFRGMGIIAKK